MEGAALGSGAKVQSRATLLWGLTPECTSRLRLVSWTVARVVGRPVARVVATLRASTRVRTTADGLGLGQVLGNLQQVVADSENQISQQVAAKLFSVPWGHQLALGTDSLISL